MDTLAGGGWVASSSRLRESHVGMSEGRWPARVARQNNIFAGCSKSPFSKAAASEEARRTLRYVEPLSDARTPLADFFSILLEQKGLCTKQGLYNIIAESRPSVRDVQALSPRACGPFPKGKGRRWAQEAPRCNPL